MILHFVVDLFLRAVGSRAWVRSGERDGGARYCHGELLGVIAEVVIFEEQLISGNDIGAVMDQGTVMDAKLVLRQEFKIPATDR